MEKHCKLLLVDDNLTGALPQFAKFVSQHSCTGANGVGKAWLCQQKAMFLFAVLIWPPFPDKFYWFKRQDHSRHVLVLADFSVYPANATYVGSVLDVLKTILSLSELNAAHVQLPIAQSQTGASALLKHRRAIEDALHQGGCDVTQHVTLLFDKPESRRSDGRKASQQCLAVTCLNHKVNSWHTSEAVVVGNIGPVPLMKVADMIGHDECQRLGAAARCEQPFAFINCKILNFKFEF